MKWTVLKTEENYNSAAIRMVDIFNAVPNTVEGDELDMLTQLIKDYDDTHYKLN